MSFTSRSESYAEGYTYDNILVTANASASYSSDISQEDADDNCKKLSNRLAKEKVNNEIDLINQTINIINTNNGASFNEKSIASIKEYLSKNNQESGAPFSAYVLGNAFTGEEVFVGEGIGQKYDENGNLVNNPINKDMIWRWASMTKLIGMIVFCKAIEDGLIDSLDDKVSKYVPEVSLIDQYVSGSTYTGQRDNYGTPIYDIKITTVPNLGDTMTIRHLINSSSGLGYIFWGLGSLRTIFMNSLSFTDFSTGITYPYGMPPPDNSTYANSIAYIEYIEKLINVAEGSQQIDLPTCYYYNGNVTYTEQLLSRIKYPLLNIPGTTTNTNYGTDLVFLSAVISGALQRKGIPQNSAQYCKEKIFDPLEMNDSTIICGSLPITTNIKKRITDSCFYRKDVFLKPNQFDSQKGINVNYNTLYVSSDPSVSDDGYTHESLKALFVPYVGLPENKYAGGFDSSCVGTLVDYTKLIKLIINKGTYSKVINGKTHNVRLLKQQSIEYLLNPKANTNLNDPYIGVWSMGSGTTNLISPSQTWCSGFTVVDKYKGENLILGTNSNCYNWGGYFGTAYIFDTSTGNYLIGGVQSSGDSWTPTINGFQPNIYNIWRLFTMS